MSNTEKYHERLKSPAEAVSLIPSGAKVVLGLGVSLPPAILAALADRARAQAITDVRVYYMLSTAVAGNTVLDKDLAACIRPMSIFHGAIERGLNKTACARRAPQIDFVPSAFSEVPRMLCESIGVDTLITTVSPMNHEGYFSFGTNTDYALPVARRARRVIVEVNPKMPRVRGNCKLHVTEVTAVVENDAPLQEVPRAVRRPQDEKIGAIIAGLVKDGSCLQMGIGAVPDAVCSALQHHRHLGIHTELLTPGLADLMRKGAVDNSQKTLHPGRSVFTFAMGDRPFYDYLDDNDLLEAHPVDYVNKPAIIAANAQMVSVNSTLEVDLCGACNSEALGDLQYSGSGGQLDFVRGASAAPGGLSIIACHSTASDGNVSRIVPRLSGPVTTPRTDVQFVVTEHGWVNVRGMTLSERKHALIGIADPRFRETLERTAQKS